MDVHARPDERPGLKEFLGPLQVRFRRPEGQEALERYATGLLTEGPNKHGATIAQAVPDTSEQRRQACLTTMPWAATDLNCQRVQKMGAEATLGEGVWGLDDPGFPKQGKASGGVARHDSGPLGKGGNGPIAVTCCDPEPQATWPVAVRLYGPKTWAEGPDRRRKARVPPAVAFQTKPEIALRLRDQARLGEGPQRGVVADAGSGDTPHFLAGLEARQERDVGGVRVHCRVSHPRQATSPVPRAEQRLAALPRWQWRAIRGRQGTTGWRRKKVVAVRGGRVPTDGQRQVGWLLGERATRGQPAERKYAWSNLPASTALEELAGGAHRRYAVEQFHEEATGEVGWDQDQGRLWPGFHRHAVTVMLAYGFLVGLERRHRRSHTHRGRPRDLCSPSAGPP